MRNTNYVKWKRSILSLFLCLGLCLCGCQQRTEQENLPEQTGKSGQEEVFVGTGSSVETELSAQSDSSEQTDQPGQTESSDQTNSSKQTNKPKQTGKSKKAASTKQTNRPGKTSKPEEKSSDTTYCTASELQNAKIPDKGTGSLTLPETVDFSGVEGVEVLHLSVEKDFLAEENVKKYAELFGVDRNKLLKSEESDDIWGKMLTYDNGKDKCLNISENGGMSQLSGFSYASPGTVVEKMYNIDAENVSGVEVRMADGKVNLAKFCKNTEKWLDEHMSASGGLHYRVSDAHIRKKKKGKDSSRVIDLCAEYDYKGIRLNNYTEFNSIMLDYEKQGTPCFFSRNFSLVLESSEPVEKIINLESAIQIVTGFGSMHITKVIPLYVLSKGEGDRKPGTEIEARPVYAFLVEEEKEPQGMGIIKVNNCYASVFVDMVTGEVSGEVPGKMGRN